MIGLIKLLCSLDSKHIKSRLAKSRIRNRKKINSPDETEVRLHRRNIYSQKTKFKEYGDRRQKATGHRDIDYIVYTIRKSQKGGTGRNTNLLGVQFDGFGTRLNEKSVWIATIFFPADITLSREREKKETK
ncbi:hypothetical protein YC2023_045297 [Brassica napus]